MQIVGFAQSCWSGNQARFILEHIFTTNLQKNFIVLNILRFYKIQMDIYFYQSLAPVGIHVFSHKLYPSAVVCLFALVKTNLVIVNRFLLNFI